MIRFRSVGAILLFVMLFFCVVGPKAYASEERLARKLMELLVEKDVVSRDEADRFVRELIEEAKGEEGQPGTGAVKPLVSPEKKEAAWPEKDKTQQGFSFDFSAPALAPTQETAGGVSAVGSGLNFGGTFDSRFRVIGGDVPGEIVHINELVLTTNIGEHISFLGEWLLQSNDFVNNVGDDHGFAYAIFSDVPFLPKNSSLKLGRFRYKYGIDAVLDAPLNPLYTQVKKNIGFASDLGVEFEGYFAPWDLEYSLAVVNGPDAIKNEVFNSSGASLGFVKQSKTNNSKPVILRLSREFKGFRLGFSYFEGRSWPFVNGLSKTRNMREPIGVNGGAVDGTQVVYKRRGSLDFSWQVKPLRLKLSGEVTGGRDFVDGEGQIRGYFLRADRAIWPNKLDLQVQFDRWDDGRQSTKDNYDLGLGLKYSLTDVAFIRAAYIYNNEEDDDYILQVYLPF